MGKRNGKDKVRTLHPGQCFYIRPDSAKSRIRRPGKYRRNDETNCIGCIRRFAKPGLRLPRIVLPASPTPFS